MANRLHNIAKKWLWELAWNNGTSSNNPGATIMATLLTDSSPEPDADDDTLDDLTEHPNDGTDFDRQSLTMNSATFTVGAVDNANDRVTMTIANIVFTAAGSGIVGATYLALITADSPGAELIATFDLGGAVNVSSGQTLTLSNGRIRLT